MVPISARIMHVPPFTRRPAARCPRRRRPTATSFENSAGDRPTSTPLADPGADQDAGGGRGHGHPHQSQAAAGLPEIHGRPRHVNEQRGGRGRGHERLRAQAEGRQRRGADAALVAGHAAAEPGRQSQHRHRRADRPPPLRHPRPLRDRRHQQQRAEDAAQHRRAQLRVEQRARPARRRRSAARSASARRRRRASAAASIAPPSPPRAAARPPPRPARRPATPSAAA